MTTDNKIYMC